MQNVTFPALAKIRDDAPRFAEGYRQVVMVVSYVMFPIMLGMSAVARDMFAVLLGEEWCRRFLISRRYVWQDCSRRSL